MNHRVHQEHCRPDYTDEVVLRQRREYARAHSEEGPAPTIIPKVKETILTRAEIREAMDRSVSTVDLPWAYLAYPALFILLSII